jgi:hypothetical protein
MVVHIFAALATLGLARSSVMVSAAATYTRRIAAGRR